MTSIATGPLLRPSTSLYTLWKNFVLYGENTANHILKEITSSAQGIVGFIDISVSCITGR